VPLRSQQFGIPSMTRLPCFALVHELRELSCRIVLRRVTIEPNYPRRGPYSDSPAASRA
jgi:hypothetical protein